MHQQYDTNSVAKRAIRMRTHLGILMGALLALGSCQGDTMVLLRIEGSVPGGQALKLRVVDSTGPQATTFPFPEDGKAFTLPGTIDFQVPSSQGRLGVFVWVESSSGGALAQARSFACFKVAARAKNTATLTLQPAAPAFSPNSVQDCKCNGELDMCDPNAVGSTGGIGGTLGTGGAVGGLGGTGGTGGSGGSTPSTGGMGGTVTDGGMPIVDASAMGGSGGVDAAVVKLDAAVVVSNELFSFDKAADWTSGETTVTQDTAEKVQGTSSIRFTTTAATSAFIRSRAFASSEVPGATTKLGLSVRVETVPDNQASIQLWFECTAAAVYNAYIERKALSGLSVGWNQLTFTLPANVVAALKGQNNGCKFWMDHQGVGKFHYDNLGFL